MDEYPIQRALQACKTCRTRKKGCDKILPKCGYCSSRSIRCSYDRSTSPNGKNVMLASSEKWRQWIPSKTTDRGALTESDQETSPVRLATFAASLHGFPRALDGTSPSATLWTEVRQMLASLNLSLDEVAENFFGGIHSWLPIISPQHFRSAVHHSRDGNPLRDFSVLVLAMLLLTLRPLSHSSRKSSVDLKSLYLSARTSFAQLKTILCASITLVQAGALIATYEYASGRLKIAYTSIGLCSRMCQVIGIDQYEGGTSTSRTRCRPLEERNTWWGVIMLER